MSEPNPDKQGLRIYRRLLRYVLPYKRMFLIAVVAMAGFAATDAGFAKIMEYLTDEIVAKDADGIRLVALGLIAVFLFRAVTGFISEYCITWVGRSVIKDLRTGLFEQLLNMPTTYYDKIATGNLISKLTFDVEQVSQATTTAISVVIRDTLTVFYLLILMFSNNWRLTLVFLLVGPFVSYLMIMISKRFRKISKRIQASMGDLTHVSQEAIEGHRVIKSFGGHAYESGHFEKVNDANRHQRMKMETTRATSVGLIQLIAAIAVAGVMFVATTESVLPELTPGIFTSLITAMILLQKPVKRLTSVNSQLQRGIAAAGSIFELLDSEREADQGKLRIENVKGRVTYEQVCFSYAPDDKQVLHDIDFEIEPGTTVAFIGRSGSGKTTLVNLLPRFYEITRGRISIDGHDIRDLSLTGLREHISLVSQNVTLFNDTVARNIAYGCLGDKSEEQIQHAARIAHAMEFIEQLPLGMDTVVGEDGIMLSGGQRQRLAIARALLKDAPILILDEATSALDNESERYIQSALDDLLRNRTTLVIAHRLSTIERADRIVVLDQGRMIESGTHAELLAANGHYAALYRLQFQEPQEV